MSIVAQKLQTRTVVAILVLLALLVAGGCRHKKYENPITKDTQQPDKVLFDKAIKDIEHGRYEVARLTLNTLMNTYDTSEYLAKAKLAIADSWMREAGSHGWAQAEAEYKDFILFYPQMEESAEAQMKICDIHFKQADKADRDNDHILRADTECKKVLTAYPNSRFAPVAAERVRQVQEVIAQGEFGVGAYYHHKGNLSAAANRLNAVTDQYPLFSGSDEALWLQGDSYGRLGPRFREKAILAYQKLVRNYPLSARADDAKRRLKTLEAEIPEADPVSLARMRYEKENYVKPGLFTRFWNQVSSRPDVSRAAKSGEPTMNSFRPTVPPLVPIPGAAPAAGAVTDVSVTTTDVTAPSGALDTQKDDRLKNQQAAPASTTPATAEPAAPAPPAQPDASKKSKKAKLPKPPKQKKQQADAEAAVPSPPDASKK